MSGVLPGDWVLLEIFAQELLAKKGGRNAALKDHHQKIQGYIGD